jgi:tripartite-type tricarboxylate transporter receptor subunit TctC
MEHPTAERRAAPRLRGAIAGIALGMAAVSALVPTAQADEYPGKPIKVIVPFSAGGGTDVLARIWSDAVGKRLNQRILVDNMPGAQGALGSKAAIKANPDGYTLLMGVASTMAINPATMADLGYTHEDVQSVAMIGLSPWLMVVTAKLPIHNVKELIAYGKAHPGELSYPVWSATGELGRKLFVLRTGVDLLAVPYKGGVAAVSDLITGRISTVMVDVSQVWPQIESGELRVLAMTSSQRTPILPDVPSIAEEGVKDFEVTSYVVLFAPLGVSKDIVEMLNKETRAALNDPAIAKKFATLGAQITDWDVAKTSEFVGAQAKRWKSVVAETKDVK